MKTELLKVNELEIKIVRKPIKNMYLRVRKTGEVEISAAPNVSQEIISSFVETKWEWVMSKQKAALNRVNELVTSDEILYFGQLLRSDRRPHSRVNIQIQENQLLLFLPRSYSDEKAILTVKNWMFKQLKQKIDHYIHYYWPFFEKQGIAPIEVKYRQMTSTWGVCRPMRGTITFNKNLIHQPDAFIEYVVVHELSHLIQVNHSSKFYQLVALLLPQWREYEAKKM